MPDRPIAPKLAGRVAIVFGGGSAGPGWGIGKACAVAYARAGAVVAVVDRVRAHAAETVGIIGVEGGKALALSADVTKGDSVCSAVEAALKAFGRIDILHNAIHTADPGALEDLTEARWAKGMEANLAAVVRTCRRVVPVMQAQGKGTIVTVASPAASVPDYAVDAAEAGLVQLTRSLAVQYAPHNIRANVIRPALAGGPMGRAGTAWDVAQAALFLASDEAGYITGVCLPVDGGLGCSAR